MTGLDGRPSAFGRAMLAEWGLDPAVTYLNHGTVGAPPRRVLAAQQAIRDEIERQPSRYLLRELSAVGLGTPQGATPRLRVAAAAVAAFLGARGDDLVFVGNATTGVNTVLRSLPLRAGDEIVITDHGYGAVAHAATFVARAHGARVRVVELPDMPRTGAVVEAVAAALRPETRLVIVDHITSESALILPVAEIAARCRARGVPVLVDGAHAPGQIALDIPALGVDWYTGNLHKWCWSPRSCAVLWASPARQAGLHPLVISWGLDQGFTAEFDWVGTHDPSAFLAAPAAIALMQAWGVDAIRAYNHALAWKSAATLATRWGTEVQQPEAMVASMVTVPLPPGLGATMEDATRLRDALLYEDQIEVPILPRSGRLWARISIQIYNQHEDVERLAEAVLARARTARV